MRKSDKTGVIICAVAFAASAIFLIVSIACMLSDIHIWHRLMPIAIASTAVTVIAFVISILLYRSDVKNAQSECLTTYVPETKSPTYKRKAHIVKGFKLTAILCFFAFVGMNIACCFCEGLTEFFLLIFSIVAGFIAGTSTVVAVLMNLRKNAEKTVTLGLISLSLPILLLITIGVMCIAIFGGVLLPVVIISWAQWGML